jgi:uncharacterized protein
MRRALLAGAAAAGALLVSACEEEPRSRIAQGCEAPRGVEPLVFESAKRQLFGYIDAPRARGPHPAVLLIHDSGQTDVTRGNGDFAELRTALRAAGFASVVWDQPGSGCSGGRYRGLADLYLRSDDVLAAVDALREQGQIDAERVGALAVGEGAWPAAMAAARGGLDFLILVGGPAADPIGRMRYVARQHLIGEGYDEEEAESLSARLADALGMMRDQAGYRDYRAAVQPLSQYPLFPPLSELAGDVYASERRYDELRESAALHVTIDVFLAALEIPVLAMWGDRDADVDWRRGVRVYEEAFERAANDSALIRLFDGADHLICAEVEGEECRLAEGFLETVIAWLRAHGLAAQGERQSRASPAAVRR